MVYVCAIKFHMKKYSIIVISIAIVLMAARAVDSIFESLQLSQEKARTMIMESFGRRIVAPGYDYVKKARALPVEIRVQGVHQLIKYAKEYSATEEFKKEYTRWRNEQLGYRRKKGLTNPFKMLDNAVDKQLNKLDDEKRMPSDPNELIKTRLEEFLDISATVDFDAQLNGRAFADPAYESKSPQWKLCYRAGKEVVEAAREDAQAWLKELE